MNDVYLENFAYPCIAYVRMRLGIELDALTFLSLNGQRYTQNNINTGDILVWERHDGIDQSDATLSIGKFGPVTTKITIGKHFGVYEGNGLVSDLTYDDNNYFPHIRLMPLSEHPVPGKIISIQMLRESRTILEDAQNAND